MMGAISGNEPTNGSGVSFMNRVMAGKERKRTQCAGGPA
jgi:hypothetical protein